MILPAPVPVRLHHLAPGATEAGESHPDLDLTITNTDELQVLLEGLARIAAGPLLPRTASPEIRVRTVREELIVRIGGGGLRVISWESPIGGSPMSVGRIIAAVAPPPEAPVFTRRAAPVPVEEEISFAGLPWLRLAALALAILIMNGVTVWLLLKPPPDFLPEFEYMSADESSRLLRSLAGDFETGATAGDRTLNIGPNGYVRLAVYGPDLEIVEESAQVARAATSGNRPILITNQPTTIEIVDADTVVLYGTTYRRR